MKLQASFACIFQGFNSVLFNRDQMNTSLEIHALKLLLKPRYWKHHIFKRNWNHRIELDLLRRYDKKLAHEITLHFPELFIKGKYVKIGFKNRGSPCYFLSFRGQKIKNVTKIEQKRLFLFTFLVSFFMAFLAQKLIYTINMI